MRWIAGAALLVSLCGGCTATQLERYMLNQSLSVTDMRYQQVMNDLARVAQNSGSLPEFAVTAAGVANVTNTVSIDTATLWDAAVYGFSKETLTAFGQHNPELQWTLDPAANEPALEGLYYACLWAIHGPPPEGSRPMELLREPRISDVYTFHEAGAVTPLMPMLVGRSQSTGGARSSMSPAGSPSRGSSPPTGVSVPTAKSKWPRDSLASATPEVVLASWNAPALPDAPSPIGRPDKSAYHLDVARRLAAIPPGWLHVTTRFHVPKNAFYRGTYGNTAVWVGPEGLARLSEFTLVMLDIATIDPTSLPIQPPKATVEITELPCASSYTPAGAAAKGQADGQVPAIPAQQDGTDPLAGNEKIKTGPVITETWFASQEFPAGNPLCTNPADVQELGKVVLRRPGAFRHMTWALPRVEEFKPKPSEEGSEPSLKGAPDSPRSVH
jgi:hypothetical protein